jgi:hypothetical protein
MNKEKCCISIDDVYGAGFQSRHQKELDKYEWEFRFAIRHEKIVNRYTEEDYPEEDYPFKVSRTPFCHDRSDRPLIVILREKVDPIEAMYGKTLAELTAPKGFEFTGEFRPTEVGEWWFVGSYASKATSKDNLNVLILRKKKDPVEEVYGRPLSKLKAPEGFEFTGEFRGFKSGEYTLNPKFPAAEPHASHWQWDDDKLNRLILRKLPPPPTIASIYGTDDPKVPDGWVRTGFSKVGPGDYWLSNRACSALGPFKSDERNNENSRPWIILRRISLKDIYGNDSVTLPSGYEWTGRFQDPKAEEYFLDSRGYLDQRLSSTKRLGPPFKDVSRLILRPTTRKKVRFIAEDKLRVASRGEWYFETLASPNQWCLASWPQSYPVLCGFREEITDPTPQIVTQADVDKMWEGEEV